MFKRQILADPPLTEAPIMPTTPEPPRRRRFLWLRILFFLLSLPFVAGVVTR